MSAMFNVHGTVTPGFEPVEAAFRENFERRGEVGLVGPREVAVDPLQREVGIRRYGLEKGGRLLRSHAHPTHSGVDLDVDRDGAAALPGAGREQRFRLQQRAGKLEDGPEKAEIEAQIAAIQQACPHTSEEEGVKGWRCRDCDLSREPEPVEEEEPAPEASAAEGTSGG